MNSNSSKILKKVGNLVYKVLNKNDKVAAKLQLSEGFLTEPITSALGKENPNLKLSLSDMEDFTEMFMDECCSNNLSVICIDENTKDIPGVVICRQIITMPDELEQKYLKQDFKSITPLINLVQQLDDQAFNKFPNLKKYEKDVIDLWMLAVNPKYRGQKIGNDLAELCINLHKKNGFKYTTVEATSFFTQKIVEFLKFQYITSIKAQEFIWKNEPLIKESILPHGEIKFYVKDLVNMKYSKEFI